MALGAPIVARETVFNREVLGNGALTCEPKPSSIVAAIAELMSAPERQAAAAESGIRRANQRFTWDLVNSRYESTLSNLLMR
jgi:glycosyltransferase involved in cell wall biosynthesis